MIRRISKIILLQSLVVVGALHALNANAMPANPSPVRFVQPDGGTIWLSTKGDEFQGWQQSLDGYTVVKNPVTGFFEYAKPGAEGILVPSGLVATNQFHARAGAPPAPLGPPLVAGVPLTKGLRPPRNVLLEQSQGLWLGQISQHADLRIEPEARDAFAQIIGESLGVGRTSG